MTRQKSTRTIARENAALDALKRELQKLATEYGARTLRDGAYYLEETPAGPLTFQAGFSPGTVFGRFEDFNRARAVGIDHWKWNLHLSGRPSAAQTVAAFKLRLDTLLALEPPAPPSPRPSVFETMEPSETRRRLLASASNEPAEEAEEAASPKDDRTLPLF